MSSFQGRIVWVTGASSGIGEALCHGLARRGARLALSARDAGRLEAVRTACGSGHAVVPLDLADPEAIGPAARRVEAALGPVEVLLMNAGVSQRALAVDTGVAVDRHLMEVNYFAPVSLVKAVLPGMLARRSGHLVGVTSLVGHFGTPLRSGYAGSKHALHGFLDSVRAETWAQGIRVTLACPGFVRTRLSLNALTGDGTPQGTMDAATARGMDPARCAEAILRAVERGRDEVLVGGREVAGVYLKRFLPGLFRRLIRRVRVTRPAPSGLYQFSASSSK
ncbi:MAG: SDR family oxidoreductase [Deferrisomatales bacterium]